MITFPLFKEQQLRRKYIHTFLWKKEPYSSVVRTPGTRDHLDKWLLKKNLTFFYLFWVDWSKVGFTSFFHPVLERMKNRFDLKWNEAHKKLSTKDILTFWVYFWNDRLMTTCNLVDLWGHSNLKWKIDYFSPRVAKVDSGLQPSKDGARLNQ